MYYFLVICCCFSVKIIWLVKKIHENSWKQNSYLHSASLRTISKFFDHYNSSFVLWKKWNWKNWAKDSTVPSSNYLIVNLWKPFRIGILKDQMVFPYHSILFNDLVSGHNMLVCKMHSENIQRFSGSFFSALTFNSMTWLVEQSNIHIAIWILIFV